MRAWIQDWGFAILWAIQPLTAGPALGDALDVRSSAFRTTATIGLWALWALTLIAALIPRTATLTLIRVVAPAAVAATAWAVGATDDPDWLGALALVSTAVAAIAALAPSTGERFVNGSAYGPERRLPLRPPGIVVLGLVELVWAVVVVGAVAGPLLMSADQWAAGIAAIVVGWPLAVMGTRSLHRLAQRWLVFVPAGLALVDPLVLADALAIPRAAIASMAAAPADTTAEDLTGGALGLAVEIAFHATQTIVPLARPAPSDSDTVDVPAVLFTPTRPGVVLSEARDRGLPTG